VLREFVAKKSRIARYDGYNVVQSYAEPGTIAVSRVRAQLHIHRSAKSHAFVTVGLASMQVSGAVATATTPQHGFWTLEGVACIAGSPTGTFTYFEPQLSLVCPTIPDESAEDYQLTRGAVLEMRPTRTSPEEKAQEEMSEFDRDYPW